MGAQQEGQTRRLGSPLFCLLGGARRFPVVLGPNCVPCQPSQLSSLQLWFVIKSYALCNQVVVFLGFFVLFFTHDIVSNLFTKVVCFNKVWMFKKKKKKKKKK